MAQFYSGKSMQEMQAQFAEDESTLSREEIQVRWGTDKPRFMGLGGRTGRPSAMHLRSPMWVDSKGRQYTPEEPNSTAHWWVRIPNSVTIRMRRAIAAGTVAASDATGFPQPGDVLQLRRFYSGVDDRQVSARVSAVIAPKQASAEIHFEQELDATWSEREKEFMRRKTVSQTKKRKHDEIY